MIATPMSQAQTTLGGRVSAPASVGGAVWETAARKVYEDEGISPIPSGELQELSRYFFADYLGYLNAIGLELASFEISLTGRKEIKDRGECSDATIKAFNELLTNSVQSDLYTFTDVYCSNACRQKAEFDFGLIANFKEPDGLPQSCADRAREMYDTYHCNLAGDVAPIIRDSDLTGGPIVIPSIGTHSSVSPDVGSGEKLIPKDLRSTTSRIDPDLPVRGGTIGGSKFTPIPKIPLISRFEADREFKNVLSKQKKTCTQKRSDLLRQTFAAPGTQPSGSPATSPVKDSTDPRWTTTDDSIPGDEDKLVTTEPRNPACKSSGPAMIDRFASLRAAYNRIANEKIAESLVHWPLYSDDGSLDTNLVRSIRATADSFFHGLLSEIEAQNRRVCGAGGTSLIADTATIGGREYIVSGHDINTGTVVTPDNEEEEVEEPVTVSTYFSANRALVDAFINGMTFGAESTGAATHTETRAGEIASGVIAGAIAPEDIGSEAAAGPYGRNAKEIENLTRRYLAQGNYHGLKKFAAEFAGGMILGGVAGGAAVVGSKLTATMASGRISALFAAMRFAIMRPFMVGAESGAINWGIKVLQTGGRTLEERTAKALNQATGRSLNKREWGKALERLKDDLGLRNDHHGKILSNGDYLDTNGRNLGNLIEYLF
ncbi:hypothetical protein [Oligoflexus tunisiensis]|uniref:hypothetical protein n=1 Tax=Oligoflexus tunisiensis TaxID=708132 RepID=UPI001C407DE3|nr:hypothetical protein [Oligoflexus tunisiensis]